MKKSIKSTIAIFLSIMIFVLSPLSVLAELEEKTDEKVSGIEDEISLSLKDGEFTFKKSELDIKTQRDKILAKIKDGLEDSNYAFPLELAVQPETPEQRLAWNSSGFNWVVVIDAWIKYIPDSDSMKPAIEYIKQKLEFLSNARLAIDLSNMVTGEYVGNIYLNKEWKFSSSVPQLQMMKFDDRCILDVNKETGESFLKIFLVQNQKDSIKNNIYLQRGLDDVELTLTEQQIILDESLDSTEGPKENPYGYVTIPIPKKGENLKIYSGSKSLEKLKDSDWYDLSFGEEWKLKDDSILKKPELLYINKRVFNFYDKVDNKQSEWDKEINGEWYSPFNNGQTAFIQTDGGEQVIDIYANNSLGADDMESLRFTIDGTEPTKDSREIYHGEYRLYPIDNKTENKTENIDQYQARNYMYMSNPNIYRLIIAGKITYENRIRNKKGTLNYIKHPENIKDGGNIVLKVKAFGKNGKESETLTIEIPQYMKEISFNDKISYKKKIFGKEREVEIVGNQYPMQNHPYRGMDINFTDITSGTEFNNIKNIMKYKNIDKFYVTKPSVSYDADLDKNFWEKSKLIYRVKGLNDLRISGKFASTYEILPNGVINTMDFYYENISNEVAIRFNPTFRNTTSIFAKEDRTKRHSAIKKESQNVLDWLNDLKAKETEGTEKYNEISKNINLLQHKITVVKENNFRDYIELNSLKNIILKSLEEDLDSYKPEEYIEIPNEDNPDEEKPDEPEYNNGMKMQPKDLKAGVYNLPINLLQFDDESLQSMGAQAIKGIAKLYVKEDGKQDLEFEVKQLPVSGIVGNILGFWYYNQPEKNPISGGAESNLLGEPSPFEIIKSEVIYNPHINEDLEVPRLVRKPIIDREPRQYVRVSVDAMDGDGSYDGPTKNAILALDYENLEYIGDIPTD
ncbi:MAG: hypothetical protein Q4P31_04705, partial [Andreesenia angusta]|nr:hypothetical protein [Andreesenia angusta]